MYGPWGGYSPDTKVIFVPTPPTNQPTGTLADQITAHLAAADTLKKLLKEEKKEDKKKDDNTPNPVVVALVLLALSPVTGSLILKLYQSLGLIHQ